MDKNSNNRQQDTRWTRVNLLWGGRAMTENHRWPSLRLFVVFSVNRWLNSVICSLPATGINRSIYNNKKTQKKLASLKAWSNLMYCIASAARVLQPSMFVKCFSFSFKNTVKQIDNERYDLFWSCQLTKKAKTKGTIRRRISPWIKRFIFNN